MKTFARLFGVRASSEVSLTVAVDGAPPPAPPELSIRSASGDARTVACVADAWTATLPAGDHVIYLRLPEGAWSDAPISFSLSAPVKIVIGGEQYGTQLASWSSEVGVMADPKNPWPPPQISPLVHELAGAEWLIDTLMALRGGISIDRYVGAKAGAARDPQAPPTVRAPLGGVRSN